MSKTLQELLILGPEFYFGHEGEGDQGDQQGDQNGESGNDSNASGGDSQGASGDSSTATDDDDDKDDDDKDVDGLKSALAKERRERRKLEKAAAAREKADADEKSKEADAVAHAQKKEQEARDKVSKLASGLLQRELDSAIRKEAEKQGFIDPADAIDGVDRNSLTYEQDDEDPTDIDIDAKSIEKVVKGLAARKPHFIKTGTDDGQRTGGGFGGGAQGDRKDKDAALKAKYSALNH